MAVVAVIYDSGTFRSMLNKGAIPRDTQWGKRRGKRDQHTDEAGLCPLDGSTLDQWECRSGGDYWKVRTVSLKLLLKRGLGSV